MGKKLWAFCLLGLGLLLPMAAVGSPRVGVARVTADDAPQIKAVANNVEQLLFFSMQSLGGYEVSRVGQFDALAADPMASDEFKRLDFVMFGQVQRQPDDSILMRVGVFSRADQMVVEMSSQQIYSVFDLFDAAEASVIEVLEGFSGEVIRFATLRFRNNGADDGYTVLINGDVYGTDIREAQVLAGSGTVQIRQRGEIVHSQDYQLEDGQGLAVEFVLNEPPPGVEDEEPQEAEPDEEEAAEGQQGRGGLEIVLSSAANIYGDMWTIGTGLGARWVLDNGLALGVAPSYQTVLFNDNLKMHVIGLQASAGYLFYLGDRFRLGPQLSLGGMYRMLEYTDVLVYTENAFGAMGELDALAEFNLAGPVWLGLHGGAHLQWRGILILGAQGGLQLGWRL
ncbi:MAG: hypothetical protein D6B26_00115 [Spirochaetaceae bacterium]|nr:MAG: hypothetical protein D6B26_00115 [Spirochaetaceae bacterium]